MQFTVTLYEVKFREVVFFHIILISFSFFSRCLFQDGKAMSNLPVLLYRIVFPVLKIRQQVCRV